MTESDHREESGPAPDEGCVETPEHELGADEDWDWFDANPEARDWEYAP